MFFLFEERRCWVRSATHTVVFDRDPDFARFSVDKSGEVRTFVRIWLTGWNSMPAYVGGVWKTGQRVRKSELRRVVRNVVRRVGRARARPLVTRLLHQLAGPRNTVPGSIRPLQRYALCQALCVLPHAAD